jgi:hypothetical protein
MARLSVELQRFFLSTDGPNESPGSLLKVTPNDILEVAGERTFGLLFALLSLLAALPILAIGYAMGIVIFLLAIQLIAGSEQPWLPKMIRKRKFERTAIQGVIRQSMPWLRRLEVISKPRLTPVCTSRTGRTTIGVAIALMALSIALPIALPNVVPAVGVFITGFGLLDDDGVISVVGLIFCAIAATFTGIQLQGCFY